MEGLIAGLKDFDTLDILVGFFNIQDNFKSNVRLCRYRYFEWQYDEMTLRSQALMRYVDARDRGCAKMFRQ